MSDSDHLTEVISPVPGSISEVKVKPGDRVQEGDVLVALEVMKMVHEIQSECDGVVNQISVEQGQLINPGDVLMVLSDCKQG